MTVPQREVPRRNRTKGPTQERRERMVRVLTMHAHGFTDRAIGAELGVSHTQVRRDRERALEDITRPAAERVAKVTTLRLEDLYRHAYEHTVGGSLAAVTAAAGVLDRIMRLYGLDKGPADDGAWQQVETLLDRLLEDVDVADDE